jgi:hypothetical protein
MLTKEQKEYQSISKQVSSLYPKREIKIAPKIEHKQKKKTIPTYLADYFPKKEIIKDSPEEIADKLNSLPHSLGSHVLKESFTIQDVIKAIKNLEGDERLDISNFKGFEKSESKKIDMNDMRWHGSGSTSSAVIASYIQPDTYISTSGQTSFIATSIVLSTLLFSIGGANQTPGTDYNVVNNIATVTNATWPNGVPPNQAVLWVYLKQA